MEKQHEIPELSYIPEDSQFAALDAHGDILGIADNDSQGFSLLQNDNIAKPVYFRHISKLKAAYQKIELCVKTRNVLETLTPEDLLSFCEQRVQGQGKELRRAVLLIWNYFTAVAAAKPFYSPTWFLTAPNGSGKTELYRTVKAFCEQYGVPIPIAHVDMSRLTEEGFKGKNASEIPKSLLAEDLNSGGYGICFLDEADKKLVPSFTAHGVDVNAAVQGNLLTLIEGNKEAVEINEIMYPFDSNKTMFVLLGAFHIGSQNRRVCVIKCHFSLYLDSAILSSRFAYSQAGINL